eukprot:Em0007g1089a
MFPAAYNREVADLQAKSAQVAPSANLDQCAPVKKTLKEPLTTIHAIVKHTHGWQNGMGHEQRVRYSAPENKLITEEILAACATEKHPTALVRSHKLRDAQQKQRRLQRKHHKLQSRRTACQSSTTLSVDQKEMHSTILTVEYMSTEESASESDEGENTGQRTKILVDLWYTNFHGGAQKRKRYDRKMVRKRSSRSAEMCRKRCRGEPSTVHKPPPSCPAWAKIDV